MKALSFLLVALLIAPAADALIVRSYAAKVAFVRTHACPSTGLNKLPCKGFVIDHIKALACGGADNKSNMQWQTIAAAAAKDRWERKGCVPK